MTARLMCVVKPFKSICYETSFNFSMKNPPLAIRVIEDPEQLAVPRLREVVFAMHLPHPPPTADDMRPVERDGGMAG
jgi:hypothetical protein